MSFRSPIIEEEEEFEEIGGTEETNFKNQLPDNCVEYLLFFLDPQLDARKQLSQIESIRKAGIELATSLTKDYIWQKDDFNLSLKNEHGKLWTCLLLMCLWSTNAAHRLSIPPRHHGLQRCCRR
jgi:hypothetical protein